MLLKTLKLPVPPLISGLTSKRSSHSTKVPEPAARLKANSTSPKAFLTLSGEDRQPVRNETATTSWVYFGYFDRWFLGLQGFFTTLSYRKRKYLSLLATIVIALVMAMVVTQTSFAQTVDVTKFKDAAKKISDAIKAISGPAVGLLIVGGLGLLLWGGISEAFRIKALRIVFFCVIGAGLLFLFADPLSEFLLGTFGNGTGA